MYRYFLKLIVFSSFILTCFSESAFAADQANLLAAADSANGYGAVVLEKLARVWQPPAGLSGMVTVSLRIGSDGRPLYCEPIKRSGNDQFDSSPCQAALAAGTFDPPPYGAITQVFITLGTGDPSSGPAAQSAAPVQQRSYAEEIMYRARPYIQIPPKVKGEFTAEVELRISPAGTLENLSILKSSGLQQVDNAIIAGIMRDGVIPVPEAGSPVQNVRLLFTLTAN